MAPTRTSRFLLLLATGMMATGVSRHAQIQAAPTPSKTAPSDDVIRRWIGVIRAGSAAAKAGLQLHDILIELDGQKTADFADLRPLIAIKKPGERIKIAYLRDGQRRESSVTLGRWK